VTARLREEKRREEKRREGLEDYDWKERLDGFCFDKKGYN